ncbi:hypothetical protein [uncultured Methanobrevibacter sp.]|uniref:hypothetical protein n=1 Tax=uncultured Methanobrevibacter sp. TaxID=253161 RepID=UPI0025CC304F|nr:hypothetical protein [uncultured Methanobrevibacter sp.]
MKKLFIILAVLALIIVGILATTLVSPILVIAEDSGEDASIDMAAKFTLTGYEWVYPGSSVNAAGQTLHNVHIDNPQDPYGAARDIITYSYNYTPHIIVSVNNDAAEAIFGSTIVDDIRANDAYNGYPGNENVQGTMDRGDAVDTAMSHNGMNIFQVPIQFLMGNIRPIFV